VVRRYRNDPVKLGMGLRALVAAQHFLIYAQQVADELERECAKVREVASQLLPPSLSSPEALRSPNADSPPEAAPRSKKILNDRPWPG